MGVRTLRGDREAAMYCSTTDWAFGPVFYDEDDHDAEERIESFLRWLRKTNGKHDDPRRYEEGELETIYHEWRAQEETQWKEEEKETDND